MTVIINRSGRWAGVDYTGNQPVTNSAIEQAMVNAGFAQWAPGSGPQIDGGVMRKVLDPLMGQILSAGDQAALAASGIKKNRASTAVIRPFGTPSAGGGTGQREGQVVLNFASRPVAVRVLMQNLEATPPTNITATFSGSTTLGSPAYVLPTGGTYVAQTWAGATPLANGPNRVSSTAPGLDTTADWMTISVPDRTDGGPGYLLFVRVHPGTGTFSYAGSGGGALGSAVNSEANAGRAGILLSATRNSTTSCAAGNEANYSTAGGIDGGTLISANLQPMYLLEVLFENGQRWIYGSGDSVTAASQITSGVLSCPAGGAFQAGYAFVNDGLSGQTTAQYLARLLAYLAANPDRHPTRLHYTAFSPNDYNTASPNVTAALMLAAKGRLMQVLDVVGKSAAIEGIDAPTPWPWNALNAANDAARLSFRSWMLSLKHPKLNVIDVESTLGDGQTPVRWKAGMSVDGLHPVDAGRDAYAALYVASLAQFS